MKAQRTGLFCLLLLPLVVLSCTAAEDAPSQQMTQDPVSATGTTSDVICAHDSDCETGMVCDWLGPEYSSGKVCTTGCRQNSQCGVEGVCDIAVCDMPPCAGTCITSDWQQAIDILGFEDADTWTATSGTDTPSSDAIQGESALSVNGPGWQFVLTSDPFGPLPRVDDDVTLAIKLPVEQPNPWWYGQLQLFVEAPSLGLYNRFIGISELTGLPTGSWVDVTFPLPGDVKSLLEGDYNDLKVTIALNVPFDATGSYLLDNLRFGDDIVPPVVTVATSETTVYGTGPFKTFKEDITLLGHVEEDIAISDVIVSIDGGTPVHPTVDVDGNFSLPLSLDRDFSKVSVNYPITITAIDNGGNESEIATFIRVVSPAVPDELIVIFNPDTSESTRMQILTENGATLSKRLTSFMWLVNAASGTAPAVFANIGAPTPLVRAVYPNMILQRDRFEPNDPYLEYMDWLDVINAFDAWDIERGSEEIIVAVVDTGLGAMTFLVDDHSMDGCGSDEVFVDNVYLNERECCENPPCDINSENTCVPSSSDEAGACPIADLNGDGCPGECGIDDDGDGLADMEDLDVIRLFSNGFDDDGDGNVDEKAIIDGVQMECSEIPDGQTLENSPPEGDCDGAANDDDENGYPDDCRGWDFGRTLLPHCDELSDPIPGTCMHQHAITHPNQIYDRQLFEQDGVRGHGTDVAMAIGEIGNDCIGYAGIMHRVKILPLINSRYVPENYPNTDWEGYFDVDVAATVEAYKYAGEAGAHIINTSAGMAAGDPDGELLAQYPGLNFVQHEQLVTDLLNLTGTDNVLHVSSAGNSDANIDMHMRFPDLAQVENVLVVGASDPEHGAKTTYSNYGQAVDLACPPAGDYTSLAAPVVAGAAGLLMSHFEELRGNPGIVADILRNTVQHSVSWEGKSLTEGNLDMLAALNAVIPQEIFMNVSADSLPSSDDFTTDDIDLFHANDDEFLDMFEVSCSREARKEQPRLRINEDGVLRDKTTEMLPKFKGSFCDAAQGDLDGDGRMDIVLAARQIDGSDDENRNRILMNNGSGFDLDDHLIPDDFQHTRAVSLCDYDSDGDLDIYFGNTSSVLNGASDILLMNDGGTFTNASYRLVTALDTIGVHKILCADLDAPVPNRCDGLSHSDCKLCADPTKSIDGLIASGQIESSARDECLETRGTVVPELVIAGGEGTATLLLRQDSAGVYQDESCKLSLPKLDGTRVTCADGITVSRQDYDVEAGDFNKDNLTDLVFVSRSGIPNPSNTLVFNNGDGTFDDVTVANWGVAPDDSREVEVGDVNGDGWDDIVVIRGNPNTMVPGANSLYLNGQDGTFEFEIASGLRTDASITTDAELEDIDGDGDLDLLLGNFGEANMLLDNTTL